MGNRPLWEPAVESRVHKQLTDLVPWQLVKVQFNRLPKVHRFAAEAHTHRLSVLLHDDNELAVIVEDLQDVHQVRARFAKPVQLGLFIAGIAPVQYQPEDLTQVGDRMVPAQPSQEAARLPGNHRRIRCTHGVV
eukprot:2868375-Amphidinium_carterae.1